MGKRKTPVFRKGTAEQDPSKGDKIKAIRTWDDIEHDSEDDFHDERGKILLDGQEEVEEEELSDREVYGLDGLDEEEASEEEEEEKEELKDAEDIEAWGTSKKAYYNADEASDIEEMREEEEEALRIQKEQLAHMDEEDFVDDTLPGWGLGAANDTEADKKLVEGVTKDLEDISFSTTHADKRRRKIANSEKIKIIQNESPELIDLLDEFKERSKTVEELQNIVEKIQKKEKQEEHAAQFLLFKYQTLMNYMTNISFYFALKASNASDVREHPVIQALFNLRQTLEKVENLEQKLNSEIDEFIETLTNESITIKKIDIKKTKKEKKQPVLEETYSEDGIEEEFEHFDEEDLEESDREDEYNVEDIEEEFKSLKKAAKKRKRQDVEDFGELDALDELDMEDKLIKKKSIRDYVAKIESKQAKNTNKYQGDSDLPYRDRVKQERKGVAQPQDNSADLDDADWDEDDAAAADEVRNGKADSDDEYYAEIAAQKAANKRAKLEEYEASRPEIESRDIEVEEGQKRLASQKILKNRGLTPHRKKENRNARVKNRMKYDKKMKKLSSTRAVYKPLSSNYGGEMSGVKTNVVKSVKLSK
ncbi:hypothetical protein G6F57_001395 [Rhizopus arrhizus]|uniref:Sas10 C-terminal domain-containing protein n=1 Tax=Rhizopus oryzae TaxID=64495 RepID=A0A9P7BU43_RHIOR|nr:hypothetical protein G6F23_004681 [Rhizopus arrhizus]KAG1428884.1 hypothetical protein G6F58_000343 [Rhizopus delemar]KAG0768321.1 hypothetical protein G6F24_002044 [Rhizopus arrhizus]KAG0796238.1 hypothetical protein G6F21_001473 [Rhizopus arrhizus]KAG0818996.1 hypothetical protein G6F20_001109 [Rhizopus arrhizus]